MTSFLQLKNNPNRAIIAGFLILAAVVGSQLSLAGSAKRLSEPVEIDAKSETFGARFVVKGETLNLKQAVQDTDCEADKQVTVKTKVSQVCQTKGCFFIATQDELYTRVTFTDYSFFVPTDIDGKEVLLNAKLARKQLSKAQAKHLNQDLGDQGEISAGTQCELTASSVRVFN